MWAHRALLLRTCWNDSLLHPPCLCPLTAFFCLAPSFPFEGESWLPFSRLVVVDYSPLTLNFKLTPRFSFCSVWSRGTEGSVGMSDCSLGLYGSLSFLLSLFLFCFLSCLLSFSLSFFLASPFSFLFFLFRLLCSPSTIQNSPQRNRGSVEANKPSNL